MEVSAKLGDLLVSVGNISSEMAALNSSLSDSTSAQLIKLDPIHTALGSGGPLVTSLQKTQSSLEEVLEALTDASKNGTLVSQLSAVYNLLNDKFSTLESILGYENYTTTLAPTTTTTAAPTTTTEPATTTTSTPTIVTTSGAS